MKQKLTLLLLLPALVYGQNFELTYERTIELNSLEFAGMRQKIEDPVNIEADNFSNLLIYDEDEMSVFIINYEGKILDRFPKIKDKKFFDDPIALAIAYDGKIYVLDEGDDKIIILNQRGEKISELKPKGRVDSFKDPIDIAIGKTDNIYVLDAGAKRVLRFNSQTLFRGFVDVLSPLAISIDPQDNIYVLSKTEEHYAVFVYNSNLQFINSFPLQGMIKPIDISVNKRGEIYALDYELGGVFIFNQDGNQIGERFGAKSSMKGPGLFAKANKIAAVTIDYLIDRVFIYDEKYNSIQTYIVKNPASRGEIEIIPPDFDVRFESEQRDFSFRNYFYYNGIEYFSLKDETIIAQKDGAEIFRVNKERAKNEGYKISKISALTAVNSNLYALDSDEDCIYVLDCLLGEFKFKVSRYGSGEGELSSPSGMAADKSGKLYVADRGNRRINIYNEQGIYFSAIELQRGKPVDVAIDHSNSLHILMDDYNTIYQYNAKDQAISTFEFPANMKESSITQLCSAGKDFIIVYDNTIGTISIFKNVERYAQFLSRGGAEVQMKRVNRIGFNPEKNIILLSDIDENIVKQYKLLLSPEVPSELKITINELGVAELNWEGDKSRADMYRIYRSKLGENHFEYFTKTKETILALPKCESAYDYSVQAISEDKMESGFSNVATDEFSYSLYLLDVKPLEGLEKLEELKKTHGEKYNKQLAAIYRTVVEKFKKEKKLDLALRFVNEIQTLEPEDEKIILEKAELYKQLLRFNEGVQDICESLKKHQRNPDICYSAVRLAFLGKDFRKAISLCSEGLGRFPDDERFLNALAESHLKLGELESALENYKKLAFRTLKEDYFVEAAKILLKLNRGNEAIDLCNQAQNLGAAGAELFAAAADAYFSLGDFADAIFQIEKSIALNSYNSEYFYKLGIYQSKRRDLNSSIGSYNKAILLDSSRADYYTALGSDLNILNKNAEAAQAFEKALKLNPDNPDILYLLGQVYLKEKKLDEACSLLWKANKLFPESIEIKDQLDKALQTRKKANVNRPAVEIKGFKFADIFPSLFHYYKKIAPGKIVLYNTQNEIIENISVEISAPELLTSPMNLFIPALAPAELNENLIYLDLNALLLKNIKTENYNIEAIVKFGNKSTKEKTQVRIYPVNSIIWDDKKRLASFIDSKDEVIREFTTGEIISVLGSRIKSEKTPRNILYAVFIWNYLRGMELNYVRDPNSPYASVSSSGIIDYIQFADQTLRRRAGDCDDLVVLISNLLESIGIETAYIDAPGHVYLAFNSGLDIRKLDEAGIPKDKVINIADKVWIPLETTIIGRASFIQSWETAINEYRKSLKLNERIELVEINKAAFTYPPPSLDKDLTSIIKPDLNFTTSNTQRDIEELSTFSIRSMEQKLLSIIENEPSNIYAINKLALLYVRAGEYDKAEQRFNSVLALKQNDFTAALNIGNIYFLKKDYENAERFYLISSELDPNNSGVLINLSMLYLALNIKDKAKEYFYKANSIDPEISIKRRSLSKAFFF